MPPESRAPRAAARSWAWSRQRETGSRKLDQAMARQWIRWSLCAALLLPACDGAEQNTTEDEQSSTSTEQEAEDPSQEDASDTPTPKKEDPDPTTEPEPEGPGPSDPSQDGVKTTPHDLPSVTGTCPELSSGLVTFSPEKLKKSRQVQIWVDPKAKGKKGPLVFYWHGTTSSPSEALTGLGPAIEEITAMGGMVAAPIHDPEAGIFPWFLVEDPKGKRLDDLYLADEILACAMKDLGIDTHRIYTLGLSAGALQSTQMSYRRANYIASSVLYSGGLIIDAPELPENSHPFSSMIFHGGLTDIVVIKFKETSERYLKALQDNNQFGFICDHGAGHIIPGDGVGPAWTFLKDHPFGSPSPYTQGLPSGFPSYCKLPEEP